MPADLTATRSPLPTMAHRPAARHPPTPSTIRSLSNAQRHLHLSPFTWQRQHAPFAHQTPLTISMIELRSGASGQTRQAIRYPVNWRGRCYHRWPPPGRSSLWSGLWIRRRGGSSLRGRFVGTPQTPWRPYPQTVPTHGWRKPLATWRRSRAPRRRGGNMKATLRELESREDIIPMPDSAKEAVEASFIQLVYSLLLFR